MLCYNLLMFRLWGKLFKNNKMLRDAVYENEDSALTRTRKIFAGLESVCKELDVSVPIWLDSNISDFRKVARTRFTTDSFVGESGFDYLEIQVIEED